MHVIVVGGTGFLGYHAVKELLRRGHKVTVLALPPRPTPDLWPASVTVNLMDFNLLSDDDIRRLLDGKDAFVYAAGADDRQLPDAPAYPFFYRENVVPCRRLVRYACLSGVQNGVLLSSYFAYFDRIWPDKRLAHDHPYIRSRREQATQAFNMTDLDFNLAVLELPFVFGSIRGRTPLWAPLIKYICSPLPLMFTVGGTNAISARGVGQAIAGAVENRCQGRFVVGDENLTWADLFLRLGDLAGRRKRVRYLPSRLVMMTMTLLKAVQRLQGKESGLNPVKILELFKMGLFLDPTASRKILGYHGGDLDQALQETVDACI